MTDTFGEITVTRKAGINYLKNYGVGVINFGKRIKPTATISS